MSNLLNTGVMALYKYAKPPTCCVVNEAGASPHGLMDVAGNVYEWVYDWYTPVYYQNSPTQNPTGPETGIYHTLRGGLVICYGILCARQTDNIHALIPKTWAILMAAFAAPPAYPEQGRDWISQEIQIGATFPSPAQYGARQQQQPDHNHQHGPEPDQARQTT